MITTNNLPQVLATLGFSENNNVFTKHFDSSDCEVTVDFKNEKIIYPKNTDSETPDGMVNRASREIPGVEV